MSPTHFKVKNLSGKIFTSVLAFTLAIIMVLSVAMTTIYYVSYEHDAEAELAASAQDAARYLNATPSSDNAPALEEQFSGLTRYTLIGSDGTVLYDSAADTSAMEVYWDPAGYSRPSRLWFSRICSEMRSMAGAIRGYIVSTESLKGTRDTERIPV